MTTLICTVGLPRSGKSTWAKQTGSPVVNPDAIRLALHGQPFITDAEPMVWTIAQYMVRALSHAGHLDVILDATNTTRERRRMWQSCPLYETRFKVFNTPVEVCRQRAALSAPWLLPVIDRMTQSFEPLGADELEYKS